MATTKHLLTDFDLSRAASSCSENSAPLSFTQESLWLADRMARQDGPAYNEPTAFRLRGNLHVDLLRQALYLVVERHDTLRTGFFATAMGLRAIIQEQFPEFVNVCDLRACPVQEAQMRSEELVISSYCRPFDLTTAPLLRAVLILLPDDERIIALTLHHLVTDGWSNALLLAEISQHYRSLCTSGQPAQLPAPGVSYKDYTLKLREDYERGAFDAGIECWRTLLKDGPELLRIPTDFPVPPRQTFVGSSCSLSVPETDLAALFDVCRQAVRQHPVYRPAGRIRRAAAPLHRSAAGCHRDHRTQSRQRGPVRCRWLLHEYHPAGPGHRGVNDLPRTAGPGRVSLLLSAQLRGRAIHQSAGQPGDRPGPEP